MRQEWTESKIVLMLSDCTRGRADRKASRPCCDMYPHSLVSPLTGKHIVQPTTDAEPDPKPQPGKVNAECKQIMDGSV